MTAPVAVVELTAVTPEERSVRGIELCRDAPATSDAPATIAAMENVGLWWGDPLWGDEPSPVFSAACIACDALVTVGVQVAEVRDDFADHLRTVHP